MAQPSEVTKYLQEIGRKGGEKSSKRMTPEERSERARLGGIAKAKKAARKKKQR